MSDIAFLLLIFFLSTTKFDMKNGLGLVLPGPTTEETVRVAIRDENLTRVLVDAEGIITVNGEVLSLDAMESRVKAAVLSNPEMVVTLRINRQAKYVHMVESYDRIRVAGAKRVSLSTN